MYISLLFLSALQVALYRLYVCRVDVVIKYPKFSSTGFIAFLRPPATRQRQFELDVEFRPDLLDGLLLFTADDFTLFGRFFAVAVVKGRVEFRYSLLLSRFLLCFFWLSI